MLNKEENNAFLKSVQRLISEAGIRLVVVTRYGSTPSKEQVVER